MSRSAWRTVSPLVRRGFPLALIAGLVAAIVGGAAAAAVSAARPDRYTAAAVFELVDYVHDGNTVSLSRGILAEQTVRLLEQGTAETIATRAAPAHVAGEWVPGPGFGELSFRVESADPKSATAAATAVYDKAGFLGFGLMPTGIDQVDKPALDLLKVQKAAPTQASTVKVVAAGVLFSGFAGFALALLIAVPMRRPETADAR